MRLLGSYFTKKIAVVVAIVPLCLITWMSLKASAVERELDPVTMITIPAGVFKMGNPEGEGRSDEWPQLEIYLDEFQIDQVEVTNERYMRFVQATGHRNPPNPYGTGTLQSAKDIEELPVVQVTWYDSKTYCAWAKKRLPTEAEWEKAARGGIDQARYPWGDELMPEGKHRCNIWQGKFPDDDTGADGYTSTAPAKSFRANDYGLYNAVGNVWEWVADWFDPAWHVTADRNNPKGPNTGVERVIRGGSFLCHDSYCNRYRVGARSKTTPESATCHMGLRCAI